MPCASRPARNDPSAELPTRPTGSADPAWPASPPGWGLHEATRTAATASAAIRRAATFNLLAMLTRSYRGSRPLQLPPYMLG